MRLLIHPVLLASPPHYATVADNHYRPIRRGLIWRRHDNGMIMAAPDPPWCSVCVCMFSVWWRFWFFPLVSIFNNPLLAHASGYDVTSINRCVLASALRRTRREEAIVCKCCRDCEYSEISSIFSSQGPKIKTYYGKNRIAGNVMNVKIFVKGLNSKGLRRMEGYVLRDVPLLQPGCYLEALRMSINVLWTFFYTMHAKDS